MGRYDHEREQVLRVSQALSAQGYFGTLSGSGGNVSLLIDGQEAVVVTPSNRPYRDLVLDDICVVDFQLRRLEGALEPSIEAPMHLAVYRHRRDVNAVVHTHQAAASAASIIDAPLPPLFDEVVLSIGPTVDVVPYGFSGSEELLQHVVRAVANRCHCYILQNHGALAIGPTLDQTVTFVELLEKTAAVHLWALASGRPVTTLPPDIVAKLFDCVLKRQDAELARKAARRPATRA